MLHFSGKRLIIVFLLVSLAALTGCATMVSKYADSTRYVDSFGTQILNDPLELYLETPGDINYVRGKDSLSRIAKAEQQPIDGLLVYGSTWLDPHYELFLLLDPDVEITSSGYREFVLDTTLAEHRLVLMCRSTDESDLNSFRNDCRSIFRSIRIGMDYRKNQR